MQVIAKDTKVKLLTGDHSASFATLIDQLADTYLVRLADGTEVECTTVRPLGAPAPTLPCTEYDTVVRIGRGRETHRVPAGTETTTCGTTARLTVLSEWVVGDVEPSCDRCNGRTNLMRRIGA